MSEDRLRQLERCVVEQDNVFARQIVDKLSASFKLSLSTSEADVVSQLSADLVKKNREIDILENCLKVFETNAQAK